MEVLNERKIAKKMDVRAHPAGHARAVEMTHGRAAYREVDRFSMPIVPILDARFSDLRIKGQEVFMIPARSCK